MPPQTAPITSTSNERVKLVRALQSQRKTREREGRFVAEGLRLLEAALQAAARPDFVLYTRAAAAGARAARLIESLASQQVPALEVTDAVMKACAETEHPQGVLAVLPIPQPAPGAAGRTLVLDGVRDPGNVGTLLRAAAACGAGDVLLAPGSADAYSPKVVRGAMGAHFAVRVRALGWPALSAALHGLPVWLADARGGVPPWQAGLGGRLALIVGGEAEGPGAQARALATGILTLPLAPGVESLNAAMAGTILLYEALRQSSVDAPNTDPHGLKS